MIFGLKTHCGGDFAPALQLPGCVLLLAAGGRFLSSNIFKEIKP